MLDSLNKAATAFFSLSVVSIAYRSLRRLSFIRIQRLVYGSESTEQYVRIHRPLIRSSKPVPIIIIIHGGFWKKKWTVFNAAHETLAPDIVAAGCIAVELEYRRREHPGGGFPGSMEDVFCGYTKSIESLVSTDNVDLSKIVIIGHSAGGQLALWLAKQCSILNKSRKKISSHSLSRLLSACNNIKTPLPCLVVGIAPCADMIEGVRRQLSDEGDACQLFMKCLPEGKENIEKYYQASPRHLLPLGVPQLIVSGSVDVDVPADYIAKYVKKARDILNAITFREHSSTDIQPHDTIKLLENKGADHYDLTSAKHPAWLQTKNEIFKRIQFSPKDSLDSVL
eukprot:GSMAST32.ASY1.ANO1.156.1 assembled CDS